MSMNAKTIPAGVFKQGCLAILDEVAETHREVVITKRGKPVARLVPVISDREREAAILTSLRGRAKLLVSEKEFLQPTMREAGWRLGKSGSSR
jgi:antitoxin (DNA-binding transcriptional repressor) of toxin-antitoxin stability system